MGCYFPLGTMIWFLFVFQFMFSMACGCIVKERIALMHIKSSVPEGNFMSQYVLDSWGKSDDCCSWKGVTCNNSTRVSGLDLASVYFPGVSSEAEPGYWNLNLTMFSPFHGLQSLDLSRNIGCFQGFDGLQGLPELRFLNLSDNRLIGSNIFDSLGKVPSLEVINLNHDRMRGVLPNRAFRTLKNLRELHLGSNDLNGTISSSFFELPHLEYLDLSGNQLNGSIPSYLFELPHLKYLDLSGNLLQGHIPINSSLILPSSLQTLKLSGNNLNGTFDFYYLWKCAMLKNVELSGNADLVVDLKFRTSLPPFQLKTLMISGCNLDNSIITGPSFLDTQRHLQILDLSNNNLTGSIPGWIWILENQVNLHYLNLANNSLKGQLDSMWQVQSNLQMINISKNHFIGQLPKNISSVFPDLEVLDASDNNITGDLPPSLCNMSLAFLGLSNNRLTGEVPTCLFTNGSVLEVLNLSNNNLGGMILGGASSSLVVYEIFLACNNFTGTLPNNLSSNTLYTMDLHDNKLSGKLDASYWNLPSLLVLSVARNNLSGIIDPEICNLTNLQILDMSANKFAGSIPNCSSKLTLYALNMSSNTLTGFPSYFFNSSTVLALDLTYNRFKGSLHWIKDLSQIQMLLLGGNRFDGQISPIICQLQYLNIIDLSHNRLSGSLPPCIGNISFGYLVNDLGSTVYGAWFEMRLHNIDYDDELYWYSGPSRIEGFTFYTKGNRYIYGRNFFTMMFGIDLSANMLSGEIPWEIGNLSHIKTLNLSHNLITGSIPASLANMSVIESLDLSYNELSGSIPLQLTHLWSLEVFSVAYNNLTGCIPNTDQFSSFSMESYLGNTNLHNLSQGSSCFHAPAPMEEEDVGEAEAYDSILYVISAASFVFSFWATVVFLFYHPFGQRVVLQI